MDVGSVIEWRVSVGDEVERGDIVAVVSTEKSDIDVESWDSGVVAEFVAPMNEEIPVGTPLLILESRTAANRTPGATLAPDETTTPNEARTASEEPAPTTVASRPAADGEPSGSSAALATSHARRRPVSPYARRVAAERGISLDGIDGSGPHGEILAADLLASGTDPEPRPSPAPLGGMRAAIADRMARSNREIPHYHLERDIDMAPSLEWLAEHNAPLPIGQRVVPAALVACAAARAARAVPELNGTWSDEGFLGSASVDLGLVISLRRGGLVVTTARRADQLGPDEMMRIMREMVTGARKGQLRSGWMSQPSITITNLGENGADRVSGIIFPPQVAIVGFGRISDRPWCVDGTVLARPAATASLAGDHRATDGAEGSRFLAAMAQGLEHPAWFEVES